MSSSTNGFLDQFKDQLQEANSKPAEGEQQQWTQEQIQQYYQQYGYYDSSYYNQQEGQAQGGTQQQADYSAYPTSYSMDPYAGSYYGYGGAYGYSGYGSIMRALPAGGPGLPGEPSRSIWVGNVNEDCSDQELQSFFAPFGMIESIKVLPAKGCAFIRFVELDAAIKAHSCMNGITVHGQQIKVGWGKAEPNAKDDGISGPPPCKNLWLGNINPDISEEQIRSAFSQFGFIEKVRILPQKGCAFVNFATLDAATNAKNQMQGATLIDRPVKINYGREGPNNGGIGDLSKPLESEKPKVPPPPPEGQPPDDYEHRKIIDKLAEFVSKNGLKFEFMIQEKHKDDPKYEFIEDGKPFNDYYRFKIWCCRYPDVDPKTYYEMQLQEESKPLVAKVPALYGAVPPPIALITAPRPPSPPPPVVEFSFSGDDESAITEIIDNLQPTRDYIRKAKNWIISKAADAGNIAAFVRAKVETIPDFDKKLNVLYLIHDVLHQAMRDRQPDQTTDAFSTAFQGHMAAMVKSMCHKESTDHREKVARVVRIWDEKKIFSPEAVKQYEQELGVPLIRDTPFTPPKEDKESKDHRDRDRDRDRHRRRDDDRDRDRDRRKRDRDRDRDRDYERDYDRESKRRH